MKTKVLAACLAGLAVMSGCEMTNEGAGAGLGAVVGGVVGNQFGGGAGNVAMTVLGAAAGAYIGSQVGASMDARDRVRANNAFETSHTGYTTSWVNPDSQVQYAITPTRTYVAQSGQQCREFTQKAWIGGKQESIYGTACRQSDGSWQVVNTNH